MQFLLGGVKRTLVIMVLFPCLGLVFLGIEKIREAQDYKASMETILSLSQLATKGNDLVHEIQKERGRSSGYLASGGTQFATELRNQRAEVNKRLEMLEESLQALDRDNFDDKLVSNLDLLEDRLAELSAVRMDVDGVKRSSMEILPTYTGIVHVLINNVRIIAEYATQNPTLASELSAYKNIMEYKERNGLQRSVFSSCFQRGKMLPEEAKKATILIAEENTYLNQFLFFSNEKTQDFIFELLDGEAFEKVNNLRNIGFESVQQDSSAEAANITTGDWFTQMTNKINLIRKLEENMGEGIRAGSMEAVGNAEQEIVIAYTLLGVIFLVSFFVLLELPCFFSVSCTIHRCLNGSGLLGKVLRFRIFSLRAIFV